MNDDIWASSNRAGFRALTEHDFGFQYRASTQFRLQTYKTRLENESRVGTWICQNLKESGDKKSKALNLIFEQVIVQFSDIFLHPQSRFFCLNFGCQSKSKVLKVKFGGFSVLNPNHLETDPLLTTWITHAQISDFQLN